MRALSVFLLAGMTAFALGAADPGRNAMAQETGKDKPKPEEAAKPPEGGKPVVTTPAEAKPPKPKLSDRLTVTIGGGSYAIRANSRGTTHPRHLDPVLRNPLDPNSLVALQQTQNMQFDSASGPGIKADVSYQLSKRLFLRGDYMRPSPGNSDMTDSRLISNFTQPGDFPLAGFSSTSSPDYVEWSLGGGYRFWPGKKKGVNSKVHVDGIAEFRRADIHYVFQGGKLTQNPFDPNSLAPLNFDTLGLESSDYGANFRTMAGGLRVGGAVSKRISVEGSLINTWYGRFAGQAELPEHGLIFVHDPFGHVDPTFFVGQGCNSTDNDPNTPNCGMVDSDLKATGVKYKQRSSHVRGLALDLNVEYKLLDWIGVVAGYRSQFFRITGGTENHNFTNEATLGCPQNKSNKSVCDEGGQIFHVKTMEQGFYLQGRFRFF